MCSAHHGDTVTPVGLRGAVVESVWVTAHVATYPLGVMRERRRFVDRYRLAPGAELHGPTVVEERESTMVIGPGGRARVDRFGNLEVEVG